MNMKISFLELNVCINSVKGFNKGTEYIILGLDETFTHGSNNNKKKCYKAINKDGIIETIIYSELFNKADNRIIRPIKTVTYIGIGDMDFLDEKFEYSVFNIINEGELCFYEIIDESNRFAQYPKELFLSEKKFNDVEQEEYEEIKRERKKIYNDLKPSISKYYEFRKNRQIAQAELAKETKFKKEEAIRLKKEEDAKTKETSKQLKEEEKKDREKMKAIIQAIMGNSKNDDDSDILNEIKAIMNKMNRNLLNFLIYCVIGVILSTLGRNLIMSAFNVCYLTIGGIALLSFKKKIFPSFNKEMLSNDKHDKEYIKLISSYSDDILLKVKKIEVGLLVLDSSETVSSTVISLIKETVSFCLESYKINDENLACDIEAFLDKTLEYIDTLKDDSDIEDLYINKKIYENISSVINRNIQVYESMICDNKQIRKILNYEEK